MSMIGLHNLKVAAGAKKKKLRRGRGNASGRGNYSGRGMKGQRARSGGKSGLILFGAKSYMQKIPKSRGFKSLLAKKQGVNLKDLEAAYRPGETVDPVSLFNKGLIKNLKSGVKILGLGKLTKNLNVRAHAFSDSAKEAVVKAGGQAELVIKEKTRNLKKSGKGEA